MKPSSRQRIEGTQADIADLYAYEAGQLPLPVCTCPAPADVQEVANYVHALEYGFQRLPELPVSLRLIREVHETLMEGVRASMPRLASSAAARTGSAGRLHAERRRIRAATAPMKCSAPWTRLRSTCTMIPTSIRH